MGSGSQATEQKFPFPKEVVLEALGEVLPNLGLQATHVDMFIGRIDVSAGMSAFSWGERVTIVVDDLEPGVCVVRIESSLKVGANLPGNHRHHKNFSRIIYALSDYLQLGEKGERKLNRAVLDQQLSRRSEAASRVTSIVWVCLIAGVVSFFWFS